MPLNRFIRDEIDPFKRALFRRYREQRGRILPRRGGRLVGNFLPREGTNAEAGGPISFDGLAVHEACRARARADGDGRASVGFAQRERFRVRERRTFAEAVAGTRWRASDYSGATPA